MSDTPVPIGDILPIPGAMPPDPSAPPSAVGTEKAEYVITLLRAAGLKVPFALDAEDAVRLWGVKLADFDLDVLERAVDQWIVAETHEFPSIGEMVGIATTLTREDRRQRAIQAGMANRQPGQVCPQCDDDKWVFAGTDDHGNDTYRPCEVCAPAVAEQHAGRHFMPGHHCPTCDAVRFGHRRK